VSFSRSSNRLDDTLLLGQQQQQFVQGEGAGGGRQQRKFSGQSFGRRRVQEVVDSMRDATWSTRPPPSCSAGDEAAMGRSFVGALMGEDLGGEGAGWVAGSAGRQGGWRGRWREP
jgi:hypothetical protein